MISKEKKELIKKLKKMGVVANSNWKIETLKNRIREIDITNEINSDVDKAEKTPSVAPQQESTLEKAMGMMLQSQVQLGNKIEKFIDSIAKPKDSIEGKIVNEDERSTKLKITSAISYKTAYNVHPFGKLMPGVSERNVSPYKSGGDFSTKEKAIDYGNKVFGEGNFRLNQINVAQPKKQ